MPMSQKRNLSSFSQDELSQPSPKRRSRHDFRENMFTNFMTQSGFTFQPDGNGIALEACKFKQKLLQKLRANNILSESATEFLNAVEETLADEKTFITALFPSELQNDSQDLYPCDPLQDSLIKLLLGCDELQNGVVDILLKKIPLYAEKENVKLTVAESLRGGADVANVPRLILNHLRWLDFINEPDSLGTKLLEMASVMQTGVACDIVSFIPDLITDESDHSSVASSLCDLLTGGPEGITASIFDALSNLTLSASIVKDVQDLAISNIACGSIGDIPIIVNFLLKSCKTADAFKEIVMELRPHLDFSVLLSSDDDPESIKSNCSLIGDAVFSSMQYQTYAVPAWLSVFEKVEKGAIHVGDVVCMFLMCCVHNASHTKSASSSLSAMVRQGKMSTEIITKAFRDCPHLFMPHFKGICKIAKNMIWSTGPVLKDTGSLLYELFLLYLDGYCRQVAVGCLVQHTSAVSVENTSEADAALNVFCSVSKQKPEILSTYANYLKDALDRMDLMTLQQVRKSYTILSNLAFNKAKDTFILSMRDEMHMILQKQLNHISERYHHIGLIGCAYTLVAIAGMESDEGFNANKEIKSLFQTINYVLESNAQEWSMFFDEMNIALMENYDVPVQFVKLVYKKARIKLDEFLGTTQNPPAGCSSNSLEVNAHFSLLNADEELENSVVVEFAKGANLKQSPALLCSLLSIVSTLENRLNDSLSELETLLCCPLYVYDAKYHEEENFLTLTNDQMECVLDTAFTVLNWFRELISVFAPIGEEEDMRIYVLKRLKQSCHLQLTLEKLVQHAPEGYFPPPVLYSSSAQSFLKVSNNTEPSKKAKPSLDKTISPTADCSKGKQKEKVHQANALSPAVLKPFYREMGSGVFTLLEFPLELEQEERNESEDEQLLPTNLHFLLEDLSDKVKHRMVRSKLPPGFGNKSSYNHPHHDKLDRVPEKELAEGIVKITPSLWKHFMSIGKYLKNIPLEEMNTTMPSQPENREKSAVIDCFELILDILLQVLTWQGLALYNSEPSGKQEPLLDTYLRHLATGSPQKRKSSDRTAILSSVFRNVHQFSGSVPTSSSACDFLKLLIALHAQAGDHVTQRAWMADKIANVANGFLQKEWNDCAGNSPRVNNVLSMIFSSYLKYSADPLDSIELFLTHGLKRLVEKNSDHALDDEGDDDVTYPLLTRSNFYIFYRAMVEILSAQASAIPSPPSKSSEEENVDLLLRWSEVVKVLELLIRTVKTFASRTTIGPVLKFARSVVESFVKSGIPACENTFRSHQDDVINLLKKFQASTRQLQHLACHSKISKDSSLTNHVPALKRCLETFVFRVKALLVLHNCHDAFWLGNLKNRNLKGEEILSQVQTEHSSDEDEGAGNDNNQTTDRSYSESY